MSTIQPNVVIVKDDYAKMQREGGRWTMENVYDSWRRKTKIEKVSLAWTLKIELNEVYQDASLYESVGAQCTD